MNEFSVRPFVAGSLVGMRNFSVDPQGRLRGAVHQLIWRPGENHAKCRCEMMADNAAVATKSHLCGFYAYTNGDLGYPMTADRQNPSGIIEGWGTVTVGTRGFRAAKARILALVLPVTPQTLAAAALKEEPLDGDDRFELVRQNYPDVPLYQTIEAALASFPLTEPPELTRDDDGFWDDEMNPPPAKPNSTWAALTAAIQSAQITSYPYAQGGYITRRGGL